MIREETSNDVVGQVHLHLVASDQKLEAMLGLGAATAAAFISHLSTHDFLPLPPRSVPTAGR